jgi:uncharacterized protein YcbX
MALKESKMRAIVEKTIVYPIKGMAGVETPSRGIHADPQLGAVGDRNFAFARKPNHSPDQWKPKGFFFVSMNSEGMANQIVVDSETELDEQFRPDHKLVRSLCEKIDIDPGSIIDTGGKWHQSDTDKPCVSFLNLASVRELAVFTGVEIDPRRFRMNVWVEGLDPFVELDIVKGFEQGSKYPMHVGDIKFHIDDLCERCKAIEQNPRTGLWDADFRAALDELLRKYGYEGSPQSGVYRVMGWYGIPQSIGIIRAGDAVTLE